MTAKLVLGTVQFGLDYGASNTTGQVPFDVATAMVRTAANAGCELLDTAAQYGNAEDRLGQMDLGPLGVVTKIGAVPDEADDVTTHMLNAARASVQRIGHGALYGLLLHSPAQLLTADKTRADAIEKGLLAIRDEGLAQRIGVSVYTPEETETLCNRYDFDLVQLPLSPIDGRWQARGTINRLKAAGVEVHVRSAFLQGVLLQAADNRNRYFTRWSDRLAKWDAWAGPTTADKLRACLGAVLAVNGVDRVVVGAQSTQELDEILSAVSVAPKAVEPDLLTDDPNLLNPALWTLE